MGLAGGAAVGWDAGGQIRDAVPDCQCQGCLFEQMTATLIGTAVANGIGRCWAGWCSWCWQRWVLVLCAGSLLGGTDSIPPFSPRGCALRVGMILLESISDGCLVSQHRTWRSVQSTSGFYWHPSHCALRCFRVNSRIRN